MKAVTRRALHSGQPSLGPHRGSRCFYVIILFGIEYLGACRAYENERRRNLVADHQ
jgi:hypothetical protein